MAKLLNWQGVCDLTGLSRSAFERLVKADLSPQPVRVTAGRLGWVEDEVRAWTRDRIAGRDQRRDPATDPVIVATAGRRGTAGLAA